MDIIAKIENIRSMHNTLDNWELITEAKKQEAIWGYRCGFDNVKVQSTPKIDRMENAIIKAQEWEEKRAQLLNKWWDELQEVNGIMQEFAKIEDMTLLHRYMLGVELDELPLTGRQKNPLNAVKGAMNRLQKTLDREAEIARQSEVIQSLIRGAKKKCKRCSEGYIKYSKEEPDRFIFVCTGCGRRLKADKIGAKGAEHESKDQSQNE